MGVSGPVDVPCGWVVGVETTLRLSLERRDDLLPGGAGLDLMGDLFVVE